MSGSSSTGTVLLARKSVTSIIRPVFRFIPGPAEAIRNLNLKGLKAIVVTNQAGVARGYFEESLIHEVHQKLRDEMKHSGAYLDAIYYCPHHPSVWKSPLPAGLRLPET